MKKTYIKPTIICIDVLTDQFMDETVSLPVIDNGGGGDSGDENISGEDALAPSHSIWDV